MPKDISAIIRRHRWNTQIRPILIALILPAGIIAGKTYLNYRTSHNPIPYHRSTIATQVIAILPQERDRAEYYPYRASVRFRGFVVVGRSHIPLHTGETVTALYDVTNRGVVNDDVLLEPKK